MARNRILLIFSFRRKLSCKFVIRLSLQNFLLHLGCLATGYTVQISRSEHAVVDDAGEDDGTEKKKKKKKGVQDEASEYALVAADAGEDDETEKKKKKKKRRIDIIC
nr:hypothetical protein [Tanacetum cinerariifolium]